MRGMARSVRLESRWGYGPMPQGSIRPDSLTGMSTVSKTRQPLNISAFAAVHADQPLAQQILEVIADRTYPVVVHFHGSTIIACDPSEVVRGDDVWGVLRTMPSPQEGLAGSWIGVLGYDLALSGDDTPPRRDVAGAPPIAALCRYDTLIEVNSAGSAYLWGSAAVVEGWMREGEISAFTQRTHAGAIRSSLARTEYTAAVARVRELIRSGDCYQVNITQRLDVPWSNSPYAFAVGLWDAAGDARYRSFFGLPEGAVISASPERLVTVVDDVAVSSPIKGTASVGDAAGLIADEKERAEHIMIVDLVRNDLGRVAPPGGVSVTNLMYPLATGYVEHLVSDIRAQLREGVTPADVLAAVFPGGSVTGCPKLAAMAAIDAIEPVPRGVAYGSMVMVAPDGRVDASVLIRTAWLHDELVWYWSGGAVTWDSDPAHEHDEAMAKAQPFLRTVGI